MLIERIIAQLDCAFLHVRHKARHKGDNDDIWDLRFNWAKRKEELRQQLLSQTFVFSPFRIVEYMPGKYLHTFRSLDKLVLKAMALGLLEVLPRSSLCLSYRGHGGVPAARRFLQQHNDERFAYKTDVADYYASLSHVCIMRQLSPFLDAASSHLLYAALSVQSVGVARGSALSHVLGNAYLHDLDVKFEQRESQHYCRYMDDILVLTSSKGALRRAVATIREQFERLALSPANRKTWVGGSLALPNFCGVSYGCEKEGTIDR